MNRDTQILIAHVVETLPSDVRRRRDVLNSLVCTLPREDVPDDLRGLLGDLDRHLIAQRELCLEIGIGPAAAIQPARGSARLGDTTLGRGGPVGGRGERGPR